MYIAVTVTAGARTEQFERIGNTQYKAKVREPAQKNRANKRARELLAIAYGVSLGDVQLVSGHRSPKKVFSVAVE
jgi:uncharacterized protein YggU (UPF0235/DUF167 family)